MKLFLIQHDNDDGDNVDLFVWADTPEEAIQAWDAYYGSMLLPAKVRVFEVPTTPIRGAVAWDNVTEFRIYG